MGKSAFAEAMARGAANKAGAPPPPGTYFDYELRAWVPLWGGPPIPAAGISPAPGASSAPSSATNPLVPLAAVVVVGAGAWWLWNRRRK